MLKTKDFFTAGVLIVSSPNEEDGIVTIPVPGIVLQNYDSQRSCVCRLIINENPLEDIEIACNSSRFIEGFAGHYDPKKANTIRAEFFPQHPFSMCGLEPVSSIDHIEGAEEEDGIVICLQVKDAVFNPVPEFPSREQLL